MATPEAWLGNPPRTVKSEDVYGLESIVGGDRGFWIEPEGNVRGAGAPIRLRFA